MTEKCDTCGQLDSPVKEFCIFKLCRYCFQRKIVPNGYIYAEKENCIYKFGEDNNIETTFKLDKGFSILETISVNEGFKKLSITCEENNLKTYCGVEGSICDKGFKFLNHSRCCQLCEYDCGNCIISQNTACDRKCSKRDIASKVIKLYKADKEELEEEVAILEDKIIELNKYL